MPERIARRKNAPSSWYGFYRTTTGERLLPLHPALGPWSETKEAVLLAWAEGLLAEGRRERKRRSDAKPSPQTMDGERIVAAAVRAALESRAVEAPQAPALALPPAQAPVLLVGPHIHPDTPSPREYIETFLDFATDDANGYRPNSIKSMKCNLNRMLRDLGDDWSAWLPDDEGEGGWWAWWGALTQKDGSPMMASSKKNHIANVRSLISWAVNKGGKWKHIPDFAPATHKPKVRKKALRVIHPEGVAEETGSPFTDAEIRSLIAAADAHTSSPAMRLVVMVSAYMGTQPVDTRNILESAYNSSFTDRNGHIWWRGPREKTYPHMIDVPVAPALWAALSPHIVNGRLALPWAVPGVDRLREQFEIIQDAAGIKKVKGESLKRFRYSFRVTLRQRLKIDSTNVKAMMGQTIRSAADVGTFYDSADAGIMVDAIKRYDAIITG